MGGMGMDPGMMGMQMGMDPMMGGMGMDPGMMGMGPDPMMGMGPMMGPDPYGPDPMMGPDPYGPDPMMFDPMYYDPEMYDPELFDPELYDPELLREISEEEEDPMYGPWYWGGASYTDYYDYKQATFYGGVYYLPEENGAYNDPVSAYNAFIAAQSGPSEPLETATAGDDTMYTSGSSSSLGNLGTLTAFELLSGNDTIGVPFNDGGGLTGSDFIKGNDGNDNMHGGAGSDVLKGGDGDDNLYGGFGNDILIGGNGSDVIESGASTDVMYGGSVDDTDLIAAANPGFGGATTDSAQDTFVFMIGQGGASSFFTDFIGDYEDGTDKLAISDDNGTTWLTNAFSVGGALPGQGLLVANQAGGMTTVMKYDGSEYLFQISGAIDIDDTDLVGNPYA